MSDMRNCESCGHLVPRSTLDEFGDCNVQCVCFACDKPFADGCGPASLLDTCEVCRDCEQMRLDALARGVDGVEIVQIDSYWDGPMSGLCRLSGLVFPFEVVTDKWHFREFAAYLAPLDWIGGERRRHIAWRQGLAAAYRGEAEPFIAYEAMGQQPKLDKSHPLFTFGANPAQYEHLSPPGLHKSARGGAA